MKILVVTSQTTYMPGNYQRLLEGLLEAASNDPGWSIDAIASVKTLNGSLIKTIIGLPFLGVFNLTHELIKNSWELLFRKRERLAKKHNIPHRLVTSMNEESVIKWVKNLNIDLILNIRTRNIYGENILKTPTLGCINIHHGILPEYRGTFCDLYALSEGREAGFSIHKMEKRVDAGKIFKVVTVDPGNEKNYRNYLKKTEDIELEELLLFFNECSKKMSLPEGIQNKTTNKIYTKNPNRKLIQEFKKKGFIL